MLGSLFGLIWMFPSPPPSSIEQRSEAKVSEKEPSPPSLPRQAPSPQHPSAAKKDSSGQPRNSEARPPELQPPLRLAKDEPPPEPKPPRANPGEAAALGEALIATPSAKRDVLLEKLCEGKGPEYTEALTDAIGKLSGEDRKKARRALADRLARFTPPTLLVYLRSESPEQRRAAALALGMKDDTDHINELMELLKDAEPSVVHAAKAALKSLTGQDYTSSRAATSEEQTTPSRQPLPPAETNPPTGGSRASRDKPQRDEDVPEVALVPPQDAPPQVKAILRANAIELFSKRPADRIKAAHTLGELGEDGKPARRLLCAAMLDPVIAVRVAAADALKNIDPKMQFLAVKLATEKLATVEDWNRLHTFLGQIQKLEDDGEPLAPLVISVVKVAAGNRDNGLLASALAALSHIGRRDLSSYRVIATALSNPDASIRATVMRRLGSMKHGKLAVSKLMVLLRTDIPDNRIAAMEALTALADGSTEEIIEAAIAAQRYHNDERVRKAVEAALVKLENQRTP
jgi:HEAT repeat protein